MTTKELINAIDKCDDRFLIEAAEQKFTRTIGVWNAKKYRRFSKARIAAAVIICTLVVGTGVTVAAANSDAFYNWLKQTFMGYEVSKLTQSGETNVNSDENGFVSLIGDMEIVGENESFVCEYRSAGDDERVEKVYSIQGNELKPLQIHTFKGKYDNVPFSFEYAVINDEICGFNFDGVGQVFPRINGGTVYAALINTDGDAVKKECIASLDLKTGKVDKLTSDNMKCNFIMSPNGKVVLCNHRSDGYWSVFDLEDKTQRVIKNISGYAHTNEIAFLDDYNILTFGKPFKKRGAEYYSTYAIDLRSGKVTAEYKDAGGINMKWSYKTQNNRFTIYNIINNDSFVVGKINGDIALIESVGDYALFGSFGKSEQYYLVNLENKSFAKINLPKKYRTDTQMHLSASEKKLLISKGKDVYAVDISKLQ